MIERQLQALLQAAVLALAALAIGQPAPAQAGSTVHAKALKAKKKKTTVAAPKATGGSAETTAERNRRLARECKGRPNAGACLGFAS